MPVTFVGSGQVRFGYNGFTESWSACRDSCVDSGVKIVRGTHTVFILGNDRWLVDLA